jgi:two-component system, NtrC family, sensor histidine kinase HydH
VKKSVRPTSVAIAIAASLVLCGLSLYMHRQMVERITLISANDNERILNALIAGLREHDDFGSVIEAGGTLSERVMGVAVYMGDGSSLYSWGTAPSSFDFSTSMPVPETGDRFVFPKKKTGVLTFFVRASRMSPPLPPGKPHPDESRIRSPDSKPSFFFDVFVKGEWLYVDILHSDYWRSRRVIDSVFPLLAAFLVFLSFFIRHLVLRNILYREDIEMQKNLVVLGTAASTLAHEIKNPLLAIRLQTSIIRKTYPQQSREELDNIDAEIARLTSLAYRINDFIREPAGTLSPVALGMFAQIVALSVCGNSAQVRDDSKCALVMVDPERLRSVIENLMRNALESASDQKVPEIRVAARSGWVILEVLDRGSGLSPEAEKNLFEPFFTTKSRGTGIGLAVSKRFIQAAGGKIELEKREGGGTIARILLPVYPGGI